MTLPQLAAWSPSWANPVPRNLPPCVGCAAVMLAVDHVFGGQDCCAMADSPLHTEGVESTWSTPMPIRHRETRHLKTSSSVSSSSATFPHITEVLQWTSLDNPAPHPSSKCPEGLNLSSAAFKAYRDRSPTSSTMSSAVMPDSATTYSMPMSPTLSTFTRATTPDIEVPSRETLRGHPIRQWNRQSYDSSSSTFVDSVPDEDRMKDHSRQPEINERPEVDAIRAAGTPRPAADQIDSDGPPPLKERMSFDVRVDRLSTGWDDDPADSSDEEVEGVLNYVLQAAYGVDLDEIGAPQSLLRRFTSRFIQDVGRIAFSGPSTTQLTHTTSASSRSTVLIARAPTRTSQTGKRKKGGPSRDGTEDDEDISEDDADGGAPFKRPRQIAKEPEENLRLSCPFRKRNPARFNVREHHSCAMTYFPKFAELRQHIVKQHKRVDPSAFVCDRCNRDFAARKDLRDHQRLPRDLMCDIADHDPECGIDGPTAAKLLSRKRAGGTSAEVQWMEIWNLVFPDDGDHEVVNWDFCPVIEHFEVTGRFLASLKALEGSLRNKGLNEQALETIGNVYRNQFIQVVEQCVNEARTKPYSNRSNRKSEINAAMPGPPSRRGPRPDSGVDVDEGSSEDSLSIALLGSSFGVDDGLGRCSSTGTEIRSSNGAGGRMLMPVMEQVPGDGGDDGPNPSGMPGGLYGDFAPGMTEDVMTGSWAYGVPQTNLATGLTEILSGSGPGSGPSPYAGWDMALPSNQTGQFDFPGYGSR
ncbi:uncharacterized protein VDAG_09062 [Verticillium dahliae VdLs.17]|uniref:C2H2-type domain-containing protein n=2 Tax=Verticillium dahliae TaxID=27337 RepID=G2XFD8_VERDV|nr:uncharacterized protein VDAG_09062 [Verticillium dahliae VdLs.17]EGY18536.1 hypothetical protein VDAG_09062 [Verticillium dahliae VdLs.17]